jgi:hypothetical protein
MRYLCKKAYNEYFIVGEYYDCDYTTESYLIINGYFFYLYNPFSKSKFIYYFYSEKEIRKMKLKKLYEMSM